MDLTVERTDNRTKRVKTLPGSACVTAGHVIVVGMRLTTMNQRFARSQTARVTPGWGTKLPLAQQIHL